MDKNEKNITKNKTKSQKIILMINKLIKIIEDVNLKGPQSPSFSSDNQNVMYRADILPEKHISNPIIQIL